MTPIENLLPILQESYKAKETGWSWLLMWQDGDDSGLVNEITGDYVEVTTAETMADRMAEIINNIGPDYTWLATCRPEAQPLERDREFWRRLRSQVDAAVLVDMVIFNRTAVWSMRGEDQGAAAAAI